VKLYYLLPLLFLSIACSDASLTRLKAASVDVQSDGAFCTQAPDKNDRITKFMFVIDKSGSNTSTDPNNAKRANNIEAFFNGTPQGLTQARKDNPNTKWGYIAFQGNTASAYIADNSSKPIFVGVNDNPNDKTVMTSAFKKQRSNSDTDTTPYHEALGLTKTAIQNDIKLHPNEKSEYVVFFMSDGMPTDYNSGGHEEPAGAAAFQDVDELVAVAPGHVTFSAAYYGPDKQSASDGLRHMAADHGFGIFVDLNKTSEFKIDDLLVGSKTAEPYLVKQVLVYNVNSAVCFDGTIGVDSDGDGLCDADEDYLTAIGKGTFDKQNRFSFGDGYGDYIHYLAIVTGNKLPACTDRSDDDNDLLTACEESFIYNQNPTGVQPGYTSKSSDPKNPDTDGDGFVDGVEFFMTGVKSTPLDAFNLTKHPTLEAPDMATLIFQHRNPQRWDPKLSADDIYDTEVQFTKFNDQGQRCYNFHQQHLKTYHTLPVSTGGALKPEYAHNEWENVVLVYFIQTLEKDPSSPGIYMYSLQKITGEPGAAKALGTQAGLQINNGVFKSYVIPGPGGVQ
jgi:hypothetical protein